MQEAQNGRRTKEGGNSALIRGGDKTPLPGQARGPGDEKKRHPLVSPAYEEALAQVHNLGALIWAAGETDEPDLKDSFIELMNTPLQTLLEAMKELEEDL